MNKRLKQARIQAGFPTATAAIEKFRWPSSTYRAHENGQNNFNVEWANRYAEAYSVSAAWLLTGEGDGRSKNDIEVTNKKPNTKPQSLEVYVEKIFALSLLLKDDPKEEGLVIKLYEYAYDYYNEIRSGSK